MPELLRLSLSTIDGLGQMNKQLLQALHSDPALAARVRLMTTPGVGQVLSFTWALEMGDISRFHPSKMQSAIADYAEQSKAPAARLSGARSLRNATNTFRLPLLRRPKWPPDPVLWVDLGCWVLRFQFRHPRAPACGELTVVSGASLNKLTIAARAGFVSADFALFPDPSLPTLLVPSITFTLWCRRVRQTP